LTGTGEKGKFVIKWRDTIVDRTIWTEKINKRWGGVGEKEITLNLFFGKISLSGRGCSGERAWNSVEEKGHGTPNTKIKEKYIAKGEEF